MPIYRHRGRVPTASYVLVCFDDAWEILYNKKISWQENFANSQHQEVNFWLEELLHFRDRKFSFDNTMWQKPQTGHVSNDSDHVFYTYYYRGRGHWSYVYTGKVNIALVRVCNHVSFTWTLMPSQFDFMLENVLPALFIGSLCTTVRSPAPYIIHKQRHLESICILTLNLWT